MKTNRNLTLSNPNHSPVQLGRWLTCLSLAAVLGMLLTGCETPTAPPDSAFQPAARSTGMADAPSSGRSSAQQALDDFYRTNSAPPAFMRPSATPTSEQTPAALAAPVASGTVAAVAPAASIPAGTLPPIVLREGDVIKVSFPGAANLNTTTQIRRDGIINLPLIGEVRVTGMTTGDLEKDLMGRYKKELVANEVTVAIASSTYSLFVTGSVVKPGKVMPDRPLNIVEAIMEAGGFDDKKANKTKVRVNRMQDGRMHVDVIDVGKLLKEGTTNPYMMMPGDIIIVPEKLFFW